MWIKLIVSLVAFGALIQSGLTCPAQCSCRPYNGLRAVLCGSNGLTSVPGGIPDNTQYLQLQGNQIERLPEGVFDRLVNLQQLWLYSNQLTSLPAGVFDKLTQLTVLELSRNQLQTLPERVFDRLVNLRELYLGINKLTELPTGMETLTTLSRFGLELNQLKSIPVGAFSRLSALTHVYLFGNPWDCECTDIMYLQKWVADHTSIVMRWDGKAVNDPDSVKCSGTNKPVRSITAAETSPEKCPGYVKPTTTTAMPTTTTPEIIPTTEPVTTAVTPKPTSGVKLNCTGIVQRSDRPGDCGNPACHTLMNCANFMSCLCASCAICQKRR